MAKTPISILQEHCVQSFMPMPIYTYEDRTVPSTPSVFACRCTCAGKTLEVTSSSKKVAKQRVAEMMLAELNISNQTVDAQHSKTTVPTSTENYIGELNEYCSKNGFSYATYSLLGCVGGMFQIKCSHQSLVSTGTGTNKKDAKQKAAYSMLEMVGKTDLNKQKSKQNPPSFNKPPCKEYSEAEIIELYKRISLKNETTIKSDILDIKDPFADVPEKKYELPKRVLQTEKYAKIVREYDPNYTIQQVGNNPIVLVLTLSTDKSFVLMEMGEVREEVEELLLSKVCEKLNLES